MKGGWGLLAAIVGLIAASSGPARAGAPADPVSQVVEHGLRATVGLSCEIGQYDSYMGTGAVLTPDGYILTSTTVVPPGATKIKVVFYGGVVREAKIVETREDLEATLVKVEASGLECLPPARKLPAVGEPVYAFSNAHNAMSINGRALVSAGALSGLYRVENQGGESVYAGPAIETSAAINPGSDGGPIVDCQGRLCGIVSLNVSPLRWQGLGVPMPELLAGLAKLKSGEVKFRDAPLVAQAVASPFAALARQAAELSGCLVGLVVERKFPAETVYRVPWPQYRGKIADWGKKPLVEQSSIHSTFLSVSRVFEGNQMLRRPGGALTAVAISPDGYLVTSEFNVEEDTIFKDKKSGQPRRIELGGNLAEVVRNATENLAEDKNPVVRIWAVLPDGSRHEAKLLAKHQPLGVAVLKIDAKTPKFLDPQKRAEPRLGMRVAVLGYMGGGTPPYTLNAGIVSAADRNRGTRFQIDAAVNYGNSGGPVISANGQWLGIAGAPISPRTVLGRLLSATELHTWLAAPNSGLAMAARGDKLAAALEGLKSGKGVQRPLGALLGAAVDARRALGDQVIIGSVVPGLPADKAGLRPGDRILALDKRPLDSWKQLSDLVAQHQPGDKIELKVQRKNIDRHLIIKGQKVETLADLQKLMDGLKPDEKFEGSLFQSDTKTLDVILAGEK
ncbi:MAG: trypsin-like peptidase domain-containing protein [Thermoguttaceae bacterium]